MVNPGDPRPPYQQVAEALRGEIERKLLRAGDPIPSTTTIMERFGVASSTAQRAVRTLKTEGLVESVAGRGVFVRTERPWRAVSSRYIAVPAEGERDRWTTEGEKDGRRADQKITFVGEVDPPDDVADLLMLGEEDKAIVRRRVMSLDDDPVELVDTYYPADIARGTRITDERKIPRGARAILADLGYPPRRVREIVYTRMPTPDEARALHLAAGTPVFHVVRTVLSDDDRSVEVSVIVLGGDQNRLVYEIPTP